MPHCSVCQHTVESWLPHPDIGSRSEFMKLVGAVGSDLSVFQCPKCGCTDRDRHLWLYMTAVGMLPRITGADVLHIAPEARLERLIQGLGPASYVRGDLHPQRAGHRPLDVEALPFADHSFDLVLCNHVLEHVGQPAKALAELRRCLRPGGLLIAQTPYAPALTKTFEMNTPVDSGFAKLFYGQEDHVRLFGADIVGYFHDAGFQGAPIDHDTLLPQVDAQQAGCNRREPFFAFYSA